MKRGDLYRVYRGAKKDPRQYRVFVVASRDALVASSFSSVICAPIYSNYHGLATQVSLDDSDGLKKQCAVHCDELMSIQKQKLTDFVASLSYNKLREFDKSLAIALGLI